MTIYSSKEKAAAWQRDYRRRNPGLIRRNNLKAMGLTPEAYRSLLDKQNGVCAICLQPERTRNQYGLCSLSVDHDHETGRIRGLLCSRCNRAEGLLNQSPDNVRRMLEYLEQT